MRRPSRAVVATLWTAVAFLAVIGLGVAGGRMASVIGATRGGFFPGPESFESLYVRHPVLTVAHVAPGILFTILGPLQFVPAMRRRWLTFHRWSGRIFLASSGLIAYSALRLVFTRSFGGPLETSATVVFTGVFVFSLGMAFRHVLRREIASHREWMIRGFAVGLGIATIRPVVVVPSLVTGVDELAPLLGPAFWIAFSLHLTVAETWIRWTRPAGQRRVPASAGAPARQVSRARPSSG